MDFSSAQAGSAVAGKLLSYKKNTNQNGVGSEGTPDKAVDGITTGKYKVGYEPILLY